MISGADGGGDGGFGGGGGGGGGLANTKGLILCWTSHGRGKKLSSSMKTLKPFG
jgi:hypothetical protein